VSNEALCVITGLKPIHIKIQETAEIYKIVRGNIYKDSQIDQDKPPKQWLHPAETAVTIDTDDPQQYSTPINIYTDRSKSEQGGSAGIVIIRPGTPAVKLRYRMDTSCTNNQAEAFTILKALEYLQTKQENEEDKTATVYTDSKTTLDSLYNTEKHISDRRDKTKIARDGKQRMENKVQMDKSTRRDNGKRNSRQVSERSIS
jgi:ribonuclease HI